MKEKSLIGKDSIAEFEMVHYKDHLAVEQGFLGASILLGLKEFRVYEPLLTSDDFVSKKNRAIFSGLKSFVDRGIEYDVMLLCSEYKDIDPVYTTEIINSVVRMSNIGEYAKAIKANSMRRTLLLQMKVAETTPTDKLIEGVQETLSNFQVGLPQDWSLKDALHRSMDEIERRMSGEIEYSTGLIDLDMVTGGYNRGDCILLAGRPGHGKSAMAVNQALNLLRMGKKVLYIDLETSDISMLQRFQGLISGVEPRNMKSGRLSEEDLSKINKANLELLNYDLTINDNTGIMVPDIITQARVLKSDIIIVDYIHLMSDGGSTRSENERLGKLVRSLKMVAMELNIPVVVLSQLNRELERRVDKKPQLSDLRESGALEQVADVVLAMYWEYKYDEMAPYNETMVRVLKQKTGPSEDVALHWIPRIMKFANYSGSADDEYVPHGEAELPVPDSPEVEVIKPTQTNLGYK